MDDQAAEEQGTVSTVTPLTIWTDPADTACPAALAAGVTITTSSRVRVQLRNPRLPLVVGTL